MSWRFAPFKKRTRLFRLRAMTLLLLAAPIGSAWSEVLPRDEVLDGVWGVDGLQIEVSGGSTLISLACADGKIDGAIELEE